ncbi:hypothetical protein EYF80_058051 [Liparis tanakae]|uniref:Uncharacterized protein n=1 Tax=Liparis tanakae TaxID=230148 RepID=A0A4Z2ET88_9TELE|nr:hypothetical protein EYF80_058051 [Liparis tanakae]
MAWSSGELGAAVGRARGPCTAVTAPKVSVQPQAEVSVLPAHALVETSRTEVSQWIRGFKRGGGAKGSLLITMRLNPDEPPLERRSSCSGRRLTLELRLEVPGVGGEAPEHVTPGVLEEQQRGAAPRQAAQHPGEALPVELRGEHQPPGGAGAVRQLRGRHKVEGQRSSSEPPGGGAVCSWTSGHWGTCAVRNMSVGMSSRLLTAPQGVSSPQGGSRGGAGRPIRATPRPSATSISRYDHTADTRETHASTQDTS